MARGLRHIPGLTLVVVVLMSCGPVSPELAAKQGEERARAATGPTGSFGIAVNNRGETRTGLSIGVTSDFLKGRDPYEVYDSCVRQKSGQGPIRPLVLE